MDNLNELWQTHRDASWPGSLGDQEGELMMLDTVIAGCVTYFLKEESLDPQRVEILQDSLVDLEKILPELADEALAYFGRLQVLASTLLNSVPEH